MIYNPPNLCALLTNIRNAINAQSNSQDCIISVNASKKNRAIIKLLHENNYIEKFRINSFNDKKPVLEVLIYSNGNRKLRGIKAISTPGNRVYTSADKLPTVLSGYGLAIVSTSKGIMTNIKARKLRLGGEVLAYV